MKLFIALVALSALSLAHCRRRGMSYATSENDFLGVCQGSVSKQAEVQVKETIQIISEHLESLKTAIDNDDTAGILTVVSQATQIMTKKIASLQGVVYAAIDDSVSGGYTGDQKRCLQNVIGELRTFNTDLGAVADVTKQAATKFNDKFQDERFKQSFEDLNDLKIQVDQFIADPSQYDRLNSKCPQTNAAKVVQSTMSTLNSLKPRLVNADEDIKRYAVEAATGLLMEGLTLNSICDAGANYNSNDQVKQRVMREDSKVAQNLANQLNSLAKYILGTPSFFRRIFGY